MGYDIHRISNEFGAWWGADGVTVEVGGWSFRVRPLNDRNRQWINWQVRHPEHKQIAELLPVLPEMLVECCVIGWDRATDADGNEIPFEEAQAIFEAHPALALEVFQAAVNAGDRQAASAREATESLGKPADGRPGTQAA